MGSPHSNLFPPNDSGKYCWTFQGLIKALKVGVNLVHNQTKISFSQVKLNN